MKYVKKRIPIEAYQTKAEMYIETLEGTMHASVGDYIITGVNGERYPCKPDIFEKTYEPYEEDAVSRKMAMDAVSRADVEHEIANILRGIFVEYQDIAKKTASKLPSVTPEQKRGKWEEKAVSDEKVIDEWQSARCSACGKYHTAPYMYYFNNYNFCPNCGARMTEDV